MRGPKWGYSAGHDRTRPPAYPVKVNPETALAKLSPRRPPKPPAPERTPEQVRARAKAATRAQTRARQALVKLHHDEYRALYEAAVRDELGAIGEEYRG